MLVTSLLVFSICIGTILLCIHGHDEIHQLMVWLSGILALLCIFILTPPLIKGLLGLLLFIIGHKLCPTSNNFR